VFVVRLLQYRSQLSNTAHGDGQAHDATVPVTNFDEMNLRPALLRGVYGYGMLLNMLTLYTVLLSVL
jgi:hypothetical protein